MKSKVILLVALMAVLFISTPVFAQQEEITLSTYYPAPYGEYDELCAEKLLVDLPSAAELQDMARGDCHITRSLIVGAGGGFSYDELNAAGLPLYDGDVIIKGNVGIGTTVPDTKLGIAIASAANVNDGLKIFRPDFNGSPNYDYLKFGMKSDNNVLYRGAISYVYNYGAENEIMTFRITTGNVGIGTTNPLAPLAIERNADVYLGHILIGTSDNNDAVLALATGTVTEDAAIFLDGSDSNKLKIALGNTDFEANRNAATKLTIQQDGNVGIGTTTPQAKLHVADGTTDIVKAYSSGIVDMPKQSMADVYRNSNYSVPVGWNKIDFDTENFDIQGEFDLTNDRFTATKAGKYLVIVNVWFTSMSPNEGLLAAIYKNGARVAMNKTRCATEALNPRDLGCTVSRIIDLSVGDYVEGWVENNSTVARTVGATAPGYTGATFMSIAKIN